MREGIGIDKKVAVDVALRYLYWVTFIMVVMASLIYYYDGYLGGDLEGLKYRTDGVKLLFFSSVYIVGLLSSYWLSGKITKFNITRYELKPNNRFVYFFIGIFSVFMALVLTLGGVGTIHRGVETNRYAELFFAAFDPYMLMVFFIYYVFLDGNKKQSRLFYFLLFVYLFLVIRSGFTGYLMLLLPIFISTIMRRFSVIQIRYLLLISVLSFPFIRLAKWILVIGLDRFQDIQLTERLYISLVKGTVERFSSVSNMIYINDNANGMSVLLESRYLPFFQGYIGSLMHKIFFSEAVSLNTLYLYQSIRNTTSDSNATFPIFSYFSLDPILGMSVLLYTGGLVFVSSRLLNLIYGSSALGHGICRYLLFFVTFFYVFNGWIWAIWGTIQALFVFLIILFLSDKLVKCPRR